jgi:phosphoribosylanthranilate isomerase
MNRVARVRIKICGVTRPEDAMSAAEAGADAIGLVFYPESPRYIDAAKARTIVKSLPPFVCKVGLFVDCAERDLTAILRRVPLDLLQFHGNESPDACGRYNRRYIKAIRMSAAVDVADYERRYSDAAALLLDTHDAEQAGGTGRTFDWDLIPDALNKPVILAGGLHAGNVGAAIRKIHPYAVDVSSGVELDKGIKDKQKIIEFVRAVAGA